MDRSFRIGVMLSAVFIGLGVATCNGSSIGEELQDAGVNDDLSVALGPACGGSNCQLGEVCEVGVCHKDCGAGGVRCSNPEVCCKSGDICYLDACTTPGQACTAGSPDGGTGAGSACLPAVCPSGQYCESSIGKCLPLTTTGTCEYRPPTGQFSPKVKWAWSGSSSLPTYNQIMMTPVVADLDGDCMPDIVFSTFAGANYGADGVLRAVRGDGSKELWTVTDTTLRAVPGSQIALADVDNDGKVEVFACHQSGALMALNFDGTKKWLSTNKPCSAYDAPSVADLNHDGVPEVYVGFAVHNARTGALMGTPPAVSAPYSVAAELDGNVANGMELVAGGVVYHMDGSLYWNAGHGTGYPAVADLDGDGKPNVVSVVGATHAVYAYKHDGTLLWGPKDVNNGVATPSGPSGGGTPTIADFNGDGMPDVATAGGYGYLVLNGQNGSVLWQSTATTDTSSRVTGSSVFDFEGDGPAEAVYNDERNLRVYDGKTGKVLVKLCNTSGTLWENPVIVDVDADDHAEIVVMANNYAINTCDTGGGSSTGFKVIGDTQNRWVRTRRIWNQHTYHVTNVNDDGSIPTTEDNNWTKTGLNNFRQNVQTKNTLAAPDLVPRGLRQTFDLCTQGQIVIVATVFNQGAATAAAGVPVTFYAVDQSGTSTAIATILTTVPILAGGSQVLSTPWAPAGGSRGPYQIRVVVDDDGKGNGSTNECNETNNASATFSVGCPSVG